MAAGCVWEALYLALRISQLAPSANFPVIIEGGAGGGGVWEEDRCKLKEANTAL